MFIEWTIKKHSIIVTTNNCHINIISVKLNETVKDSENGTPLFDLT